MTRDEWRTFHRAARQCRQREAGFYLMRDDRGLGVTQRHEKGHLTTSAALVNVLDHAAAARSLTPPWRAYDHAAFIDKARRLRKYGTWL